MTIEPAILLTLIALAATLVARHGIAASARRAPVAARLRLVYGLVAALLGLRLLFDAWPATPVVVAMMVVVAWLPGATLRLAEELVRRHAPRLVKLAALGGALVFTALALTLGLVWSGLAITALAAFQALAIIAIVILLVRNRHDVAPAERQAADLFAVALLLALPLVLTDFQRIFPDLSVRGGAFAVLVLLLATSRLVAGQGRPRQLAGDLLLALAGGGIVALALSALPTAGATLLPAVACGVAGSALLLLVERFARAHDADAGLMGALAAADYRRSAMLAAHPLLDRGVMVEGEHLSDYPPSVIDRLAEHRLVSAALARRDPALGEAATDLLTRLAASHLLRLSQSPPRFLAISTGGLAETGLDEELELAARLLENAP